ncbi:MAG: hypothetical protein KGQ77_06980 [Betaproteobacteria bacterium]|nr:hypothetical protein [Betaproteobacteria bacterium]
MTSIDTKAFAGVVGACFIATIAAFSGVTSAPAERATEVRHADRMVVTASRSNPALAIRQADRMVVTASRMPVEVASVPAGRPGVARDINLY